MERVQYAGWSCARIVSGEVEALVTLDVGPRVIRLGFIGDVNQLHEGPKDAGKKGGTEYRSYGGHRLWIGPENAQTTLEPENEPIEFSEEEGSLCFRSAPDRWHLQRELRIKPEGDGVFSLEHRIYNRGGYAVSFAPWALTVMRTGGECLFPQPSFQPHSENFLPVRPLVLWSYTNMSDPRWTWGRRLIRLKQDERLGPQKIGALLQEGYAAYLNEGVLFVKTFPFEEGRNYTDFGCNFETFTREDMLEVESLGQYRVVEPGSFASHPERWKLERSVVLPEDEDACADLLQSSAEAISIK